jgi:hypothetical protein
MDLQSGVAQSPSRSRFRAREDDAADSGYGGSVISDDELSMSPSKNQNLFEHAFSDQLNGSQRILPSARAQELYQEHCRLLINSIQDTKHVLKVALAEVMCSFYLRR